MKILLSLLITIFLTSCCEKPSEKRKESILCLNLTHDPDSLDPRFARNLADLTLVKQLFEGLTRLDAQGIPQPAVASSIEVSDDLLTYTFHLRNTVWSNGDPVTASHFQSAWASILSPSCASDYAYMLYPIKNGQSIKKGDALPESLGVHVADEKTLVITLETPTPYFLELTAFPIYFPIHPEGISNGPFRLDEWILQSAITLKKNPHYWDADRVFLDGITFSLIDDRNTESQLFETHQIDWLGQPLSQSIVPELLTQLQKEKKAHSFEIAGTLWLKFNIEKEPFDNLNIRKAFSYAINRHEIIDHILQGNQIPATALLPPCMAVTKDPYFQDGAIPLAQSYFYQGLSEKGWDHDIFPKVTFYYPAGERNTQIAQVLQQQWEKSLGVHIELQALERAVCLSNFKRGRYPMSMGEWIADFNDPLAFLEIFKTTIDPETNTGLNDTRWQDERYIKLLDLSLREKDPNIRQEILHQAEQILMEAMPIIPLYHYAFDYVKAPCVHDVILSPLGIADFKQAKLSR